MSRRALPVAVAAAALVLVPSTASAAPGPLPETRVGESLYAFGHVSLSDGRRVLASLSEVRNGPGGDRRAAVSLSVMSGQYCWPTSLCDAGTGYAYLQIDPEELDFDRNLAQAAVTDLPVTLQRWTVTAEAEFTRVEEEVVLDLVFTGTGDVVRDTYHGESCGDGWSECQSTRVDATRTAAVELTIDDASGSAVVSMHRGRSVDAAIKYEFGYPG